MAPTLRQLTYFVALAETGSFGLAASRVNISQPALSLQIKEMENSLDAQLVERLPRQLRLTRAGEEVLRRARKILADVEDLRQAVRWSDGLSGRLRLGLIPTIAPYVLPRLLTSLQARHSHLDLRVREAKTEQLIEALTAGQLDAVVMASPLRDDRYAEKMICEDRFVLVGREQRIARLEQEVEALRPSEIDPDDLLLLDEGHCLADQSLEICGLERRRDYDLGATSLPTLCGLVSRGLGLTLLPELALRAEMTSEMSARRFAAPEPSRIVSLVWRAASLDQGWSDELSDHIEAACSSQLAWARRVFPRSAPGSSGHSAAS